MFNPLVTLCHGVTDYNHPTEWPAYSQEQKCAWYTDARVRWHMRLQHEAGMWQQFSDVDGLNRLQADRKATKGRGRFRY